MLFILIHIYFDEMDITQSKNRSVIRSRMEISLAYLSGESVADSSIPTFFT